MKRLACLLVLVAACKHGRRGTPPEGYDPEGNRRTVEQCTRMVATLADTASKLDAFSRAMHAEPN